MGTKRKKYGSVSNAKKQMPSFAQLVLRKNGETSLYAALHTRQEQAVAACGIAAAEAFRDSAVKQRDESNAGTAKKKQIWPTAVGRLHPSAKIMTWSLSCDHGLHLPGSDE